MPTVSRARRAFSLLEVAAATSLFAVIALGLSLAVGSALANRANAAIRHAVIGELDAALETLATTSFATLADDTFTPPSVCAGDALLGTEATSCLLVAERTFEVAWSVSFAADVVYASTDAVGYATIIGSTELPDGSTLARTKTVPAPTPGFTGDGLLRVSLTGDVDNIDGSLYLLDADVPTEVIATAEVRSFGAALFRAPATACTLADPCRLGLAPTSTFSTDGTMALAPTAVLGPAAAIVLEPGVIVQRGVELFTPASLRIAVVAESDTGTRAPAPTATAGSVCLWLRFNDGAADRIEPSCNTSASFVEFESYGFDPSNPSLRAPLPPGAIAEVLVDYDGATCPDIGQLGAEAGVFTAAAVCTSWTWGIPSALERAGTVEPLNTPVRLVEGRVERTAVFSGALARPAAGLGNRPLWANPRAYGACAATTSCAPLLTEAPEATVCPNQWCLSARVPVLVAPSNGLAAAVAVSSASTTFTIEVEDPYGDPVQVQLLESPQSGMLSVDTGDEDPTVLGPLGVIGVSGPGSPGVFDLVFDETEEIDIVWFTVRLTNGVPDGVRDVEIALYRTNRVWALVAPPVTVAQSGTVTADLAARSVAGSIAAAAVVALDAPLGLTVPASVTLGSDGTASFAVSAAADLTAGEYVITLTAQGGRSIDLPVTVVQAPAAVSLTVPPAVDQASASVAVVEVLDAIGAPVEGALVEFSSGTAAQFTTGVRTNPGACSTDATGACSVALIVDRATPVGTASLTATARAGAGAVPVATTESFDVDATVSALTTQTPALGQGASSNVSLTVRDGTGAPLSGVVVAKGVVPAGFSIAESTRTSNASGAVTFTVSVDESTSAGPATIPFTVAGTVFDVPVTVRATPTTLTAPSLAVLHGGSVAGTLEVLDAAGDGVASANIVFTTPLGVSVATAPSDASGTVSFTVLTTVAAATGSTTITASLAANPSISTTLDVSVLAPPSTVVLSGAVPTNGRTNLVIAVADANGAPVVGAVVALEGLPSSMRVSPRATTDTGGIANVLVDDTGTAVGRFRGKLTVSFEGMVRFWTVSIPVTATASSTLVPSAMAAPQVVAVSPTSVSVAYTAPISDGGSPVVHTEVYRNGTLAGVSTASPFTVPALGTDTTYAFQVRSCNVLGCGPFSAPTTAMPAPAPATSVTATRAGSGAVSLTWSAPTSQATAVAVRSRPTTGGAWTTYQVAPTDTAFTVRRLDNGVSYTFEVRSTRNSSTTSSTPVVLVPAAAPAAPTNLTALITGANVSVSWTPGVDNGASVSSFEVYVDGVLVETVATPTASIAAPAEGATVKIQVRSCNAVGCSPRTPAVVVSA